MNIVDVIKFLALKGEFNVVISPSVQGRSTVFFKQCFNKRCTRYRDYFQWACIQNTGEHCSNFYRGLNMKRCLAKKFSDKTEVNIIRLTYAKPSYVLAALDSIKSNVGKIIIDEDTGSVVIIDTPESTEKIKAAIKKIEKPLETFVFTLQYASADVVASKLRARIDAKAVGSITPDERSNKLIVRAFPSRLDEIKQIIKKT